MLFCLLASVFSVLSLGWDAACVEVMRLSWWSLLCSGEETIRKTFGKSSEVELNTAQKQGKEIGAVAILRRAFGGDKSLLPKSWAAARSGDSQCTRRSTLTLSMSLVLIQLRTHTLIRVLPCNLRLVSKLKYFCFHLVDTGFTSMKHT